MENASYENELKSLMNSYYKDSQGFMTILVRKTVSDITGKTSRSILCQEI